MKFVLFFAGVIIFIFLISFSTNYLKNENITMDSRILVGEIEENNYYVHFYKEKNSKNSNISNTEIYSSEKEYQDYLIINNKRYGPFDHLRFKFSEDLSRFILVYAIKGQCYINFNDEKTWGPYKCKDFKDFNYFNVYISPNGKSYAFKFLDDYSRAFYNVNGNIYGPFEGSGTFSPGFDYDGSIFLIKFNIIENYYINLISNEGIKTFGPYKDVRPLFSRKHKCYGFSYEIGDKFSYININGEIDYKVKGGSDILDITDDCRKFAFRTVETYGYGNHYVTVFDRISNKEYTYGPYHYISPLRSSFAFFGDGNNFFIFVEKEEEKEENGISLFNKTERSIDYYVIIPFKNLTFGPFDSSKYPNINVYLSNNENFAITTLMSINPDLYKSYVYLSSDIIGPYDSVGNVKFSKNSIDYGFTADLKGKDFLVINNKEYGPFDQIINFDFVDNRREVVVLHLEESTGKIKFDRILY